MNLLLSASSLVFPLVTFPYVSRVLESDGVGAVSYATSVVAYFCMLASLGIPSYGIRACAEVRDDKRKLSRTAQELMLLNFITAAVSFFILLVLFRDPLIAICGSAVLLEAIGALWLYRALERYSFITLAALFCKITAVILMFLFVRDKNDAVIYGLLSTLASFGVNVFSFVRLKKYILIKPVGGYNITRHIRPALVFFATSVAISVYTNLDTVMLGVMKTQSDVGIYSAAVKIKSVLTMVATSVGSVVLARLSAYYSQGLKEKYNTLLCKTSQLIFTLSLGLTVFFMMYAEDAVLILSGDGFKAAVLPTLILLPTVLIVGLSNITGILTLVPIGREKCVMVSVAVGALADFLLNLLLIPRYSFVGAALSTLIAECVVLLIQLMYLKGGAPRIMPLRPIACCGLCAAFVSFINIDNRFLNISVGFAVFSILYFFLIKK